MDSLDCLRHHAVVRSDDQDDDVRRLRSPRAHSRKGSWPGVSRRSPAFRECRRLGADMLRDPSASPSATFVLTNGIESEVFP